MAKETIRQHYVPKTYMKRFSSERNDSHYIMGIDKMAIQQEKIIEFNTANVCLRKNLYTLNGNTEKERQKIEKFYSEEIENNYNNVYSMLTNPTKVFITPNERELILSTIIAMLYRTTKWISEHNKVWDMSLERVYYLCEQTGSKHFQFEGERISIEGKSLQQIQKEFATNSRENQVKTQLEVAFKLISVRLNDGIFVSKLGKSDCRFITSDNPVVLRNSRNVKIIPFDRHNTITLPLDEKHKLMIMPTSEPSEQNLIVRHTTFGTWADLDMIVSNGLQLENSEKFILGSEENLKEYLLLKKEFERPMTKSEKSETKTNEEILNKIKSVREKISSSKFS